MGKLYIDITELASWEGRLTGVPRVMNELARRYAESEDVLFVAWKGRRRSLGVVDFHPVSTEAQTDDELQVSPANDPHVQLKRYIRKSRVASKGVEILRKAEGRARRMVRDVRETHVLVEPGASDTLFVLADWHGSDPHFVDFLLARKTAGMRLVQVCVDVLPIVAPQYSNHATAYFTRYVRKIYPVCDLIISISKHTSKDVAQWLGERKLRIPPIKEIRLGDDFTATRSAQPLAKNFKKHFPDPDKAKFILNVGTVEARKNHTLLYYTYKLAAQRGIVLPPLIVVGRPGWLAGDIEQILTLDPETKDKIIFMRNLSDNELSWLYEHCQFSIYPSFYEGWGLPVAESIAYGVPCLCSNTSSIPEIAGDLLRYFSPYSTDECLAGITDMLDAKILAAAEKDVAKYQPVAWDDTYKAVSKMIGALHDKED